MADLSATDVFVGDTLLEKLLEELEAMYPHYAPVPKDDIATIMFKAGQRSVVDYIAAKTNVRS